MDLTETKTVSQNTSTKKFLASKGKDHLELKHASTWVSIENQRDMDSRIHYTASTEMTSSLAPTNDIQLSSSYEQFCPSSTSSTTVITPSYDGSSDAVPCDPTLSSLHGIPMQDSNKQKDLCEKWNINATKYKDSSNWNFNLPSKGSVEGSVANTSLHKEEPNSTRLSYNTADPVKLPPQSFPISTRSSTANETSTTKTKGSSKWDLMFEYLVQFKQIHGHCLVPNRYKPLPQLGSWVSTQRRQHKVLKAGQDTPLTEERAKKLESIGFVWATRDPRHVPWEQRFKELCEYKKEQGDCLVPIGYKRNPQLSNWVSTQRQEWKVLQENRASRLTDERITLLNQIGFVWEAQRGGSRKKRKLIQDGSQLADSLERKLPPNSHKTTNSMSHFTKPSHSHMAHDSTHTLSTADRHVMSENQNIESNYVGMDIIAKAAALSDKSPIITPFICLSSHSNEQESNLKEMTIKRGKVIGDMWMSKFNELKQYKDRFGDTLVPNRFEENPSLGKWVSTQRRQYKLMSEQQKSSMTPERIELLNSINFKWEVRGIPFLTTDEHGGVPTMIKGFSDKINHEHDINVEKLYGSNSQGNVEEQNDAKIDDAFTLRQHKQNGNLINASKTAAGVACDDIFADAEGDEDIFPPSYRDNLATAPILNISNDRRQLSEPTLKINSENIRNSVVALPVVLSSQPKTRKTEVPEISNYEASNEYSIPQPTRITTKFRYVSSEDKDENKLYTLHNVSAETLKGKNICDDNNAPPITHMNAKQGGLSFEKTVETTISGSTKNRRLHENQSCKIEEKELNSEIESEAAQALFSLGQQ